MIRRGEPSHRRYTELCNRSGSPQLKRPAHPPTNNADALEDYWEDASVSLRSCHSWEAPWCAWIVNSSAQLMIDEENEESKKLCDIRPCRCSFDASDYLGSVKGRRSFPPPMASCSTLSIKEGGRFVLKEMDADRPQGFFRAQRGNGRLLLRLVLPDELNDEDTAADDRNGADEEDEGSDNEDNTSADCAEEAEAGLCEESVHVEYDAHGDEQFSGINYLDHISSKEEVIHNNLDGPAEKVALNNCDRACEMSASEGEVFDSIRPLGNVLQGAGSNVSYCSTLQDMSREAGSWMRMEDVNFQVGLSLHVDGFSLKKSHLDSSTMRQGGGLVDTNHHIGSVENHFVAKSSFGESQHQQESLWDVDVANHARASLSPWSSNPLCLHQSLVSMRPPVGLAMS